MSSDPLERIPIPARLWAAAVLCLATLGLRWSVTSGFLTPGYVYFGDCGYSDGPYCTPDQFVPGSFVPGSEIHGYSTLARPFVVFAALALAGVAVRVRTDTTRRIARLATLAIGFSAVWAVAERSILPLSCFLLALALVVPLLWGRPGTRILAPASVPR